jgi:hypothetical protein
MDSFSDSDFLKRDLEASMPSQSKLPTVPSIQDELEQRADAMRRSVGQPDTRGDVVDVALRKLFTDEVPLAKGPARLTAGTRWPDNYAPSCELLENGGVDGQKQVLARLVDRNPKLSPFITQFSSFLEEQSV